MSEVASYVLNIRQAILPVEVEESPDHSSPFPLLLQASVGDFLFIYLFLKDHKAYAIMSLLEKPGTDVTILWEPLKLYGKTTEFLERTDVTSGGN